MFIKVSGEKILAANRDEQLGFINVENPQGIKISEILEYKYIDDILVHKTESEIAAELPQISASPALSALIAENTTRINEQDMALIELADLIIGGIE